MTSRHDLAVLAATALAALPGCGGETTGEELSAGSTRGDASGSGGRANGAAASDAPGSSGCPGGGGPAMVALPEGYCIDSTEVTRAQYGEWLDTNPATNGQIADCAANTSFTPDAACTAEPEVCQGSGCGDHPQTCVDWCDAYAFCRAVGKRLCGKIGGGSVGPNDYDDPSLDQWFNACSSHGQFMFPYGDTYRGSACNGGDYWVPNYGASTTLAAGSLGTCQSPSSSHAGIYDLSGNVWEWEDSCGPGGCSARGGSYTFYQPYLACGGIDSVAVATRTFCLAYVGFRCCS